MGANCSRVVKNIAEGRRYIEDVVNSSAHSMNPDGDACIIDTKTNRVYVYRLWFDRWKRNPQRGRWRTQRIKSESSVKKILPTIAGIYGPKPSGALHLIAMVRLD